ncbi:hypothetical protein GEMRC1_010168 [Eukaryota sp. GEM-RC1]
MISHSCIVCKAAVFDGIAVCCDQVVCSQKCHKHWQVFSSMCDPYNALPSSLLSSPDLVSHSITSSLACEGIAAPKTIRFQQTLLILINSYLLRTLWKSDTARDRSLRRIIRQLPAFMHKVGYVSQRFFESALLGLKVLFESNTFSVRSPGLPLLLSIKSYFQSRCSCCVLESR